MITSDPIADMLTRIRNANMAEKKTVDIPNSKVKSEVARLLKEEGFINGFSENTDKNKNILTLDLKYTLERDPIIQGLKRISKPSCRMYVNANDVPRVLGGIGIAIISSSEGIITDSQARKKNIGGEVLCYIW